MIRDLNDLGNPSGIKEILTVNKLEQKWLINKNMPCITGNSTQRSIMTYIGKESKEEWIQVYE